MWQYYENSVPGQVVVVGVEMWSGCSISGTRDFRNTIGATFPILLDGWSTSGGHFPTIYGTYDNYIIVNKQGIVRYHADINYSLGNRYHLNEIRATVDSLIDMTVSVDPGPDPRAFALTAAPNPFSGSTVVSFTNPIPADVAARITVHDLAGRRVVTLLDGRAPSGPSRIEWDGRDASGARVRPGVYLIHAEGAGQRLTRRVVQLR